LSAAVLLSAVAFSAAPAELGTSPASTRAAMVKIKRKRMRLLNSDTDGVLSLTGRRKEAKLRQGFQDIF
jgi:hypothetical protein